MVKLIILFLSLFSTTTFAKEYWIVQNVGTLTMRLYEKDCSNCPGKMVFQSPMIVGKDGFDKDGYDQRTQLGFFKITKWNKFYVDNKEAYIRWDGRKMPKRGQSRKRWGAQGAFGVYTALLEPRNFQHLHGTIGWPNESARFLEHDKKEDGSLVRVGSGGCTRVDNQVIMYLRNFVPVGTPVIRIYAKEIESLPNKIDKIGKWTYVFYETKDLKDPFPLNYEHRKKIKEVNLLEVGDFIYSKKPTLKPLRLEKEWISSEVNGNPYKVSNENIVGYFNIDTGLISKNYVHPKGLPSNSVIFDNYFEK